ncbi:hypothetical protein [Rhodobacter ferrooxidans]|uniref:Uncharacterized protein n=1 Tax=Rhodobacter ferrooxidans TaxID=371731 RepID=C8S587_9RHOB|nr:hypothetical protein [Rhodobacter sp. SW2]EEW23883.1 conserved hypothetical protein [Rhodobacter sp. SW2]
MNGAHLLICLLLATPQLVEAADYSDPDWPCIQPRVDNLSPGLMWPQEVQPVPLSAQARDLVAMLALRRVGLPQAEAAVRGFAATTPPPDAQLLGSVFLGVFDKLDRERHRLIGGIARYANSQTALAARIETARGQIEALMAATAPDFDAVDRLEEQIDWDERIYHDRARALTAVCETPVLLEKRAFAIAQILLKQLPQ